MILAIWIYRDRCSNVHLRFCGTIHLQLLEQDLAIIIGSVINIRHSVTHNDYHSPTFCCHLGRYCPANTKSIFELKSNLLHFRLISNSYDQNSKCNVQPIQGVRWVSKNSVLCMSAWRTGATCDKYVGTNFYKSNSQFTSSLQLSFYS